MKKNEIFKAVEELRKSGGSIKEIGKKFKISPSTASLWLQNVRVSEIGKDRLLIKQKLGRQKGVATNKNKRRETLRVISENCPVLKEKEKFNSDNIKIFLSLLYWCEGSKTGRRVDFTNSDPEMINVFLFLFRESFSIKEDKLRAVLHLHDYHDKNEMLKYWSKITGIEIKNFIVYNKKNSGINKKAGYRGCLSVRYGDVKILEEIFLIIKRFMVCFD
jgi:hypothetical protein